MIILQKNKKHKKRFVFSCVFLILTVLWTGLIFSMSMQTAAESSAVSGGLLKKILYFVHNFLWFDIEFQILHNFFRKLAHFTEFFILGILSSSFLKSLDFHICFASVYCLAIAISDETIQYFTGEGRAAQIKDIMIDFSGSLTAVFAFLLIGIIINKIKNKE